MKGYGKNISINSWKTLEGRRLLVFLFSEAGLEMPIDSNPSKAAPVSSSGETEMEYEDPPIYIRAERHYKLYEWYVIKGNSEMPEGKLLRPIFPPLPKHQSQSGCGVLGSTIYVLGGTQYTRQFAFFSESISLHDVYYIDTRHPSSGWKEGCPMTRPRVDPYAVTVDDLHKMYVFGGIRESPDGVSPWAEVFDGQTGPEGNWSTALRNVEDIPYEICGHVVMDDKKTILLHAVRERPCLYSYDIESDTWGIYSESSLGDYTMTSSAFVDGILYFMDNWQRPGIMYGLDVSNPQNQIQRVLGCDNSCFPETGYDDPAPEEFMVSLGNSKLAVVWSGHRDGFVVCCSKLNMSKRLNATTGQVDFVATHLSLSYYSVTMRSQLVDCFAVFPSKNDESKEEACKDTSTSNNINNSNNNNNDGKEENQKKKNNRNRTGKGLGTRKRSRFNNGIN
ncbi:hypothetical protein RHGRI_000058 [Rhododendron griersonianum]|uniref:Kelch repeat-containing protein n=1 Tax=Rhododendron griersonianum TaxID=479676 RepID=A0AAV6LIB7_9ERIC|nr:hypothetical protein RHGRI_000058 [Rhododendron griersonianum]